MTDFFIWFEAHATARLLVGLTFLILFGILYFRFTGGAGKVIFLLVCGGLAGLFFLSPVALILSFIPLFLWLVIVGWRRFGNRTSYQPAQAVVEAGGIKRGLTAPEAAVMLEMPLNTLLATVLVGLLKKGLVIQSSEKPLVLEVAPAYRVRDQDPMERGPRRQEIAQGRGVVIFSYEEPFLEQLESQAAEPLRGINFTASLRSLLRHAAQRMQGYNLVDTVRYYRQHLGRTRHDLAQTGQESAPKQILDRHVEWILLNQEFAEFYEGYHLSGVSQNGVGSLGILTWVRMMEGELANAIPAGALKIKDGEGRRMAIGGTDPVSNEFFLEILYNS